MSCEQCGGSGWITVETHTASYAKRCICYQPPVAPAAEGKRLTKEVAVGAVAVLCDMLAFAPAGLGRAAIVDALMDMCATAEQVDWLTRRACELHTEWKTCGLRGLRQILSSDSRYLPNDGLMVSATEAYPEGIPSTRKDPEPLRLPPGHISSGDLEMEQSIQRLAQVKSLDRPQVFNPDFKRITQDDIDKARAEWAERKAREERDKEAS
jgi:hypothetical protein